VQRIKRFYENALYKLVFDILTFWHW